MELFFIAPSLRKLDLAATEVLACCVSEPERPPRGVAGLVDFRLAGRISRFLQRGDMTGRLGEVTLVPGKPKLPFDKLLFFGIGDPSALDERRYRAVVTRMLETLSGLRTRTAVVELPGRHDGRIEADRAADLLLEQAAQLPELDSWTLVETPESARLVSQRMIQERRRVRRGEGARVPRDP